MDRAAVQTRTERWLHGMAVGQAKGKHESTYGDMNHAAARTPSVSGYQEAGRAFAQQEMEQKDAKRPNSIDRFNAPVGPAANLGEMTLIDSDDEMGDVMQEVVEEVKREIPVDKGKAKEEAFVKDQAEDSELFASRFLIDKQITIHVDSITLLTSLPLNTTTTKLREGLSSLKSVGLGFELHAPQRADPDNPKNYARLLEFVNYQSSVIPARPTSLDFCDDDDDDTPRDDQGVLIALRPAEENSFVLKLKAPSLRNEFELATLAGLTLTIDVQDPDQQFISYCTTFPLVVQDRLQTSIRGAIVFEGCYHNQLLTHQPLQDRVGFLVRIEMCDVGRAKKVIEQPVFAIEELPRNTGTLSWNEARPKRMQPVLERFWLKEETAPIKLPDLGPGRIPLHFDTLLPYAPGEKLVVDDISDARMSRLEIKLQRRGFDEKYQLIHRIHNHIIFSTPPSTPAFHAAKVGWRQYAKLVRVFGAEDTLVAFLKSMYSVHERLEMYEEYLIGVRDTVEEDKAWRPLVR